MIQKATTLTFCLLLSSSIAAQVHPTLAAVGDDEWVNLNAALPSGSCGRLAFSGMAYDTLNRTLLLFGGGHADGWDDRIFSFSFDTLSWTADYAGSGDPFDLPAESFDANYPGAVFDPPGEGIADATPVSLHTYDNLTFIRRSPSGNAINEMYLAGASSYRGTANSPPYWPKHPDYTWTYSHNTRKWTWRGAQREPSGKGSAAVYADATRLVYFFEGEGGNEIWSFDVDTNNYDYVGHLGNDWSELEIGVAYVERVGDNPAIYLFGGEYPSLNLLRRFDVITGDLLDISPGGAPPGAAGGYGLTYDSRNDVLLVARQGGYLSAFDFASGSWIPGGMAPGLPDRTHGNFKYDPVANVAIMLVAEDYGCGESTWAYRYRTGELDTVAPSVPSDLVVQ